MESSTKKIGYIIGGILVVFVGAGSVISSYNDLRNINIPLLSSFNKNYRSAYSVLPYIDLEKCVQLAKSTIDELKFEIISFDPERRKFIFSEPGSDNSEVRCVGNNKANYSYAFVYSVSDILYKKIESRISTQRTSVRPSRYDYNAPNFHNATYAINISSNEASIESAFSSISKYMTGLGYKRDFCTESKCIFYRDGMKFSFFSPDGFYGVQSENEVVLILNVTGGFWLKEYAMPTREVTKLVENIPSISDYQYLFWDWK